MAYATSTIIAAAAIASAVVAAGGAVYSADATRKTANYNADVGEQNALAEADRAKQEELAHRESVRRIISSQRALYGKSGLSMEGSPLLVMEDTAEQGELDSLAIRYGGDVAAARERSGANLSRMQGRQAMTSGYINAGSTLLAGASSSYKAYKGK